MKLQDFLGKAAKALNSRLVWIALVVILILLMLKQCRDLETADFKSKVAAGNLKALQGQVDEWKTKNGDIVKEFGLVTGTNKELKGQLGEVWKQYKDVLAKEAKGRELISYLNTQITYRDKTIDSFKRVKPGEKPTGPFFISSDSSLTIIDSIGYDKDNYRITKGIFHFVIDSNRLKGGSGQLENSMGMSLQIATTWDTKENMTKVAVTSPFKGLDFKVSGIADLETRLNAKPKKSSIIGLGIFGGYGIGGIRTAPSIGPLVGVGIYYAPSFLQLKINNKK